MRDRLSKLKNVYNKYGFFGFFKKLYAYIVANYINRFSIYTLLHYKFFKNMVAEILSVEFKRVVLWRSSFGYDVPLFQRPQHISRELAKSGCLVLYEVTTVTDSVKAINKVTDGFYLINYNNILISRMLMKALSTYSHPKYVQIYSTDWKLDAQTLTAYKNSGFGIVYEYIDELSEIISGTSNLPKSMIDKYNYVMSNPDCFVVVTADLLWQDVVSKRGKERLCFSSNGVDFEFFQNFDANIVPDKDFSDIIDKGLPILCYYGALASWFDYELLKKLSDTGEYSIVLIGIKYDDSFDKSKIGESENVHFLGPRDYKVLKYYARCADVLMIPFLINDITNSTSPVKLFEYMALGKPIVTTDMPECRKYESVLIGKSHEDFISKIETSLTLKNSIEYQAVLKKEARENDWAEKARAIISMLEEHETK